MCPSLRIFRKFNSKFQIGPLTHSLKIGEKWEKVSGTEEWPDLAVYPTSPWNIGLEVNRTNPSRPSKFGRNQR